MSDPQAALDAIYDQFNDDELEQLRLSVVALRDGRTLTVAEAAARAKWEALGGPQAFDAVCVQPYLATAPLETVRTA